MANNITGPVWRIDTVPFQYNFPVRMKNVQWTDQTTAGDSLVVQSVAGVPIIDAKAQAVNASYNFGDLGTTPSLKLITLTSGVLTINVGSGK